MAAKKKKNNDMTIAEFKSWIAGIEDMNEDDWVPNAVQWGKIRSKISLLTEQEADVVEYQQPQVQQYAYQQQLPPVYQPPMPQAFSHAMDDNLKSFAPQGAIPGADYESEFL